MSRRWLFVLTVVAACNKGGDKPKPVATADARPAPTPDPRIKVAKTADLDAGLAKGTAYLLQARATGTVDPELDQAITILAAATCGVPRGDLDGVAIADIFPPDALAAGDQAACGCHEGPKHPRHCNDTFVGKIQPAVNAAVADGKRSPELRNAYASLGVAIADLLRVRARGPAERAALVGDGLAFVVSAQCKVLRQYQTTSATIAAYPVAGLDRAASAQCQILLDRDGKPL